MKELLKVENLSKVFMIGLFTKRVVEAVAGVSFSINGGNSITCR